MEQFELKIILLGESQVGKTSIITNFSLGYFSQDISSSQLPQNTFKPFKYKSKTYNLNIWDTLGQERFKSLTQLYFRDVDIAIFVFDINNNNSFKNLIQWIDDFNLKSDKENVKVIAANKCDIKQNFENSEYQNYATQNDYLYIETSAKNNINIQQLFEKSIQHFLQSKFPFKGSRKNTLLENIDKTKNNQPQNTNQNTCYKC